MRINQANDNSVFLGETSLKEVEWYTYLGSIVGCDEAADRDIKMRIQKTCLCYLWHLKEITGWTKYGNMS